MARLSQLTKYLNGKNFHNVTFGLEIATCMFPGNNMHDILLLPFKMLVFPRPCPDASRKSKEKKGLWVGCSLRHREGRSIYGQ